MLPFSISNFPNTYLFSIFLSYIYLPTYSNFSFLPEVSNLSYYFIGYFLFASSSHRTFQLRISLPFHLSSTFIGYFPPSDILRFFCFNQPSIYLCRVLSLILLYLFFYLRIFFFHFRILYLRFGYGKLTFFKITFSSNPSNSGRNGTIELWYV